ncbi:MAG TPA: response regulator [Bacteroidia bacterium]|nr:response regulator [Arcobacter sp.]HIP33573.1 response regulator [Bacteroidia bacterium]
MKTVYDVLVVDDSESSRDLILNALNNDKFIKNSCRVDFKENYREAIQWLDENKNNFDILISDLYFYGNPKGFDICKVGREMNVNAHIILITSQAREDINPDILARSSIDSVCERSEENYLDNLIDNLHEFIRNKEKSIEEKTTFLQKIMDNKYMNSIKWIINKI